MALWSMAVKIFERLVAALRRLAVRDIVIYSLSLTIPFLLEHGAEILELQPPSSAEPIFLPIFSYQQVVTAGPRKPRTHFVRIVMIDKNTEPDELTNDDNPCPQRPFVARLLRTLETAGPSLIVIDKYYSLHRCSLDDMDEATRSLQQAVREVSSVVPIVIGFYDKSREELANIPTSKLQILDKTRAVVLAPSLPFGPSGELLFGLLTINFDTRKIPLNWPVYPTEDAIGASQPNRQDTLAVVAARRYDPTTFQQPTLLELVRRGRHPFTSFIRQKDIPTDSAIDIVCDHADAKALNWATCPPANTNSVRLRALRNRIVVIGQNSASDFGQSAVGPVPGVVLQANYIESLLDDRYLKPANFWIQLIISLTWLTVIEWIFRAVGSVPELALVSAILASAGLWLAIDDVAVVQLGYYVVLWPPSALAIVGKYVTLRLDQMRNKATKHQDR